MHFEKYYQYSESIANKNKNGKPGVIKRVVPLIAWLVLFVLYVFWYYNYLPNTNSSFFVIGLFLLLILLALIETKIYINYNLSSIEYAKTQDKKYIIIDMKNKPNTIWKALSHSDQDYHASGGYREKVEERKKL